MAVTLKTYNELLGQMVRKLIADTPLNDINRGSVLLTLLEAVASNDFENNAAILNILELLNIDVLKNNDLDLRAADLGLTRRVAQRSTGFVTISDSSITKRSTGLYPIKPAPIAGATTLYVNDASEWEATGTLYIGRGTSSFEGPISYTAIADNGTFFAITLGSALQNDHLISDIVVDAQSTTDRVISAGTTVRIPSNNLSPEITYSTLRDAVIPAGEDTVTSVEVVATKVGSQSNAGIGTITSFSSPPFTDATVINTSAFTNGRDVETDIELRERIKAHSNSLARGTKQAILSAIIGVSDSDDNKQIVSAVVTEPASVGEPSIIYIDDGSGLQPSFTGQSVDVLLAEANGREEFLQLANFPLPRPQVINSAEGPFELVDGSVFRVMVDGEEEEITFEDSDFTNITAATLSEIVIAINARAELFACRLHDNSTRLLVYPTEHDAEIIQVSPLRTSDDSSLFANSELKFPTDEQSYIKLYKNSTLLKEKERSATLFTTPFSTWNVTTDSNIIIAVDGTPAQDRTFTISDFTGISSYAGLELEDWVEVFNTKFAGLVATASASGRMQISSNKVGSSSSIEVLSGDLFNKWFADEETTSVGQDSEFSLNRQTGNLRILTDIDAGDRITAGTEDARGNLVSSETISGNYNVSTDASSRPAEIVTIADGDVTVRSLVIAVGSTITISEPSANVMRIMASSLLTFKEVQPLDYIYLANRGDNDGTGSGDWIDAKSCGLFKIIAKGGHTSAGTDSYVEVQNYDIVTGAYTVVTGDDVQAFKSTAYPQIWKGADVDNPAAESIQGIVDSFNDNLANVEASIYNTNSIKLTSTTENDGSIATPVSIGMAELLFATGEEDQTGNPSHLATKKAEKDVYSVFRRTTPAEAWLDRYTYSEVTGEVDTAVEPKTAEESLYSEEIQSADILVAPVIDNDTLIAFTKGSNTGHVRSIRDIQADDTVGTQHTVPATVMDHLPGDEFVALEPLAISDEDSIVFILDQDAVNKTIDIPMARTGLVNSSFPATSTAFSANDADNEDGVTFGTLQVWGKTVNSTEFADYAVWFRARNWYTAGGTVGNASLILRAKEYGPAGENITFKLEYPSAPDQDGSLSHTNVPSGTDVTYFFGSGAGRATGAVSGTEVEVSSLGSDEYRYTFLDPINLSSVLVGDIVAMTSSSGVSASNRGSFKILAKGADYIEVYNPDGAATGVGAKEETEVTCGADVIGTAAVHTITTTDEDANTTLHQKYFKLYDDQGMVVFWYDVGNVGASAPTVVGANRYVKIPTVSVADPDTTVASLTAAVIEQELDFTTTVLLNVITVTNVFRGAVTAANAGDSGFSTANTVAGVDDASIDGGYFILYDEDGSIAVWYDVTGGTPEPLHGASRSIRISTVVAGDSADTVATKTAAILATDSAFDSVTVLSDVITVVDAVEGGRSNATVGTLGSAGFDVEETVGGSNPNNEIITQIGSFNIFPLADNAVSDIVDAINDSDILVAVANSTESLTFDSATREELYTPAGVDDYSDSLAYGHDPDSGSNANESISLYDGHSWVKTFSNTSPHFVLKKPMVLVGESSHYSFEACPNPDTDDVGEFFKLLPRTIHNLYHHMTHKALSQLPIVADVSLADDLHRVQVKSKLLGSNGAIEVVGGRANKAEFALLKAAEVSTDSGTDFLEAKIDAFPNTLNIGDAVMLENANEVKRLSRLSEDDTIDVYEVSNGVFDYRYNHKDVNFTPYTRLTITDSSASHSKPAGTVWRWAHDDSGSSLTITDKAVGVVATAVEALQINTTDDAINLQTEVTVTGTASLAQKMKFDISGDPVQGDYFTFGSQGGDVYVIWLDVDADGTAPVVTPDYMIEVDILSTDTPNQIITKIATRLASNATADIIAFNAAFNYSASAGASFSNVAAGDLLMAYDDFYADISTVTVVAGTATALTSDQHLYQVGDSVDISSEYFNGTVTVTAVTARNEFEFATGLADDTYNGGRATGWSAGNWSRKTGASRIAGLPVIAVNAAGGYVDVVNPHGVAMDNIAIGVDDNVGFTPTPSIKWELKHSAKASVTTVVVLDGFATATTTDVHNLKIGDTFTLTDNEATPTTNTVIDVISSNQFKYETAESNGTYSSGHVIRSDRTATRYTISSLGYGDLMRLKKVGGDSPKFTDCGVAVDDLIVISGSSFNPNNSGTFRILGIDNDSMIFENASGVDELHTIKNFNNLDYEAGWTVNSTTVTGVAGTFKNLSLGDWVKKVEDPEDYYRQVIAFSTGVAATAVSITLGSNYSGATGSAAGVAFDTASDVYQGVELISTEDITIYEGDTAEVGDSLYVNDLIFSGWFSSVNSGSYEIQEIGTDSTTNKIYLRVLNDAGVEESAIDMGVDIDGMFILEGLNNKFSSIRQVQHLAIDEFNSNRRVVYLSPAGREYKFSDTNGTVMTSLGKIGFNNEVSIGIDGYQYYTGILRTVQRIIDGFEPDIDNYPGRRAIGGAIELLPPLSKQITMSIEVTTNEGVNLSEISNEIKSAVIRYVNQRQVGEDVVLSEIIVKIMAIKGVEAVTFTDPDPSTERISVADNEKAIIESKDISIT